MNGELEPGSFFLWCSSANPIRHVHASDRHSDDFCFIPLKGILQSQFLLICIEITVQYMCFSFSNFDIKTFISSINMALCHICMQIDTFINWSYVMFVLQPVVEIFFLFESTTSGTKVHFHALTASIIFVSLMDLPSRCRWEVAAADYIRAND